MFSASTLRRRFQPALLAALLTLLAPLLLFAAETVPLTSLDLAKMRQGYGTPQIDKSIRGKALSIGKKTFEHGVGSHAAGELWIDLAGGTDRFQAMVGVDDAAGGTALVEFKVIGDGKTLFASGVMKTGQAAKAIDVELKGIKTLLLLALPGGRGITNDHADWAEANFTVSGAKPKTIDAPGEEAVILTPKPAPAPRINGPTVYGCRPGHPFIYRIPATGERPMTFTAAGLPASLKLDSATGIITGNAPTRGETVVTLRAQNKRGQAERKFRIVSGDTLALTPPMGWNHWYAHYNDITDQLMREAADVMLKSGMADVGYQYVNIDDCWMNAPKHKDPLRVGPARDDKGNMIPNKHFPDMKGLTDYIHASGLKAGLYTSPGPLTCAGFAAAYEHEAQDAKQFADWGFDFLKHDWCSYGKIAKITKGDMSAAALEAYKKPYSLMGGILKRQERDIVFNLCQYGMGNVWEWGAAVDGHCWRTAGDLGYELNRIFEVALKNAEHRAYSKPGQWNDPDYIQIGFTGQKDAQGGFKRFPITPNESYSFMSLWCLMASPLFYSGNMNVLDEFTINVLCNPEVIEVDQDPLGISAEVKMLGEDTFLMIKPLEDGSKAVGLFNKGYMPATLAVRAADLGISGKMAVRDLWRQKDLGTFAEKFETAVPRHGVVMMRVK